MRPVPPKASASALLAVAGQSPCMIGWLPRTVGWAAKLTSVAITRASAFVSDGRARACIHTAP
jgi:hypothetical protein